MNSKEIETINTEGLNVKQRFGFIPKRLESDTKPELSNFPQNILFVSYKSNGEQIISGTAIYEPDLESYKSKMEVQLLAYVNIYRPENQIYIGYEPNSGEYHAHKFINGEFVQRVEGSEWNSFFGQFTGAGLSLNEGCKMEIVKS